MVAGRTKAFNVTNWPRLRAGGGKGVMALTESWAAGGWKSRLRCRRMVDLGWGQR